MGTRASLSFRYIAPTTRAAKGPVVSKNTNELKPGAPGRFGLALRPELSVDKPRRVRKCERSRNLEWAGLAELLGDHESVR